MTLDRNSTAQPPPRMVCVFVATSLGRAPEPATIPSRLANHTKSLCTSAHETVGSTFSGDAVVGAAGGELAEAGAAVADATPVGAVGSATAGWVAAGAAAVASTAAGAATAGLEAAGAAAAGAAAGASPPNSLCESCAMASTAAVAATVSGGGAGGNVSFGFAVSSFASLSDCAFARKAAACTWIS